MASSASLYSTFATSPARRSSNASTMVSENDSLLPANMNSTPTPLVPHSPNVTRFLSDFTLGFSDGLTVPFALTAGLSSLGSTDTVITAGLAELVAGSISMGIGGYLAALDELPNSTVSASETTSIEEGKAEERRKLLTRRSKNERTGGNSKLSDEEEEKLLQSLNEEMILQHLQPLALSEDATSTILADLRRQPSGILRAALRLETQSSSEPEEPITTISPITSGLSISIGYVVGGIIPLVPYFFLSEVGAALQWSIGLCLLALYLFGSGKCWFFKREGSTWKRCVFEGMQMMILGGVAAASAIFCVELLDRSD